MRDSQMLPPSNNHLSDCYAAMALVLREWPKLKQTQDCGTTRQATVPSHPGAGLSQVAHGQRPRGGRPAAAAAAAARRQIHAEPAPDVVAGLAAGQGKRPAFSEWRSVCQLGQLDKQIRGVQEQPQMHFMELAQ